MCTFNKREVDVTVTRSRTSCSIASAIEIAGKWISVDGSHKTISFSIREFI